MLIAWFRDPSSIPESASGTPAVEPTESRTVEPDCPREPSARQADAEFTIRDEANALTAFAFRNGFIEELHAGKASPLLEQPEYSRITDDEMRRLMIEASEKLAQMLRLKRSDPGQYEAEIRDYHEKYCRTWRRE